MEAFFVSTGVVALAEIGDKTQLLAFVLAARYKRPLPIVLGILVATIVNHALAGAFGGWIAATLGPSLLRWILAASFLLIAAWTLIPDTLDDDDARPRRDAGVFGATLLAFFLAEMGDKTQLATIAMAANYAAPIAVVAGSTLGMMIANVPAVLVGERLAVRLPLREIRWCAAAAFAVLGVVIAFGGGARFGV